MIQKENGSWIPPVYIEGTWESMPESGYARTLPLLSNEKLIGLCLLFGLFFALVDWTPITSVILPLFGNDVWLAICMVLLVGFRFMQLLFVRPVGGKSRMGLASPKHNEVLMNEILGEVFLTFVLCLLVWLKNPLALGFVMLFLWGRLRVPLVDEPQFWPEEP